MNKKTIVDLLKEYDVVAAQLNDHNVEYSLGSPRRVTLSLPIFRSKTRISKGDRIAIVDMDKAIATICEVTQVETIGPAKKPLLHLKTARKVDFS